MTDIEDLLQSLVVDLRAALGDDLIALYLYGSTVSGGFHEGVSDVDLIAVTSGPVDTLDQDALDAVHAAFVARNPGWSDRLEIVYVEASTLAGGGRSSARLAVISPGEPFHLTGPASDWLQNWYLVRETGVALVGPPPGEVIGPITHAEFIAAARRYLDYLAGQRLDLLRPGALAYAVLSVCRAVLTIETGRNATKQDAAAWMRERSPSCAAVIDEALACRLARGAVGLDGQAERQAAIAFIESSAAAARSAEQQRDAGSDKAVRAEDDR